MYCFDGWTVNIWILVFHLQNAYRVMWSDCEVNSLRKVGHVDLCFVNCVSWVLCVLWQVCNVLAGEGRRESKQPPFSLKEAWRSSSVFRPRTLDCCHPLSQKRHLHQFGYIPIIQASSPPPRPCPVTLWSPRQENLLCVIELRLNWGANLIVPLPSFLPRSQRLWTFPDGS